jgi:hypothetical protein
LWLDTRILQQLVQLWSGAVYDNRVKSDMVEEGQSARQALQVLSNDSATDFDNGKLL